MKLNFTFLLVIISLGFIACENTQLAPSDVGYNYYPNTIGSYQVWEVDSIDYNDFTSTVDTFHFYKKQLIESKFTDNEGDIASRIECYYKDSIHHQWQLTDVWYAIRDEQSLKFIEENIKFVKLNFPVKLGISWDGNIYNTYDSQDYEYTSIDQPQNIGAFSFDSTLTVQQHKEFSLISEIDISETYARNIGMVSKTNINIEKEVSGVIISGVDVKYTLIDYRN